MTYNTALAPGTYANRAKQARSYLRFALNYRFQYLTPSVLNISMYVQYLANSLSARSSVKNYFSGAKLWVQEHLGDITSLTTYEANLMIKSVVKKSSHVTRRALPLTLAQVYKICDYLDMAPSTPKAIKPCLLIGYACYLRASNLTCTSINSWGGPHTLRVADVIVTPDGVRVTINSTKCSSIPSSLLACVNSNPKYCPRQAWVTYINHVKPFLLGPAFVIARSQPVTSMLLVDFMKASLKSDPDVDVSLISTHSLRRGATQNAVNHLTIPEIMKRGGWRSKAGIAPYLFK